MKIVALRSLRFGNRTVKEGEEIELPDKFAQQFLRVGRAKEAGAAKKKPAKKEEPPAEDEDPSTRSGPKAYKTRRMKAEDND